MLCMAFVPWIYVLHVACSSCLHVLTMIEFRCTTKWMSLCASSVHRSTVSCNLNTIAWHTHKNCYPREQLWVLASSIVSTREFYSEYSQVRLPILMSTIASTRVCCEYSRVFSSLALASFDSCVGNALLVWAHSHSRLALVCDMASDTSQVAHAS